MLILRGKQPLKRRHRAAADLVSTLARAGDACMASLGRQHRYDQFQADDPPLLRSARPVHIIDRLQRRAHASGARVRLVAATFWGAMRPENIPRTDCSQAPFHVVPPPHGRDCVRDMYQIQLTCSGKQPLKLRHRAARAASSPTRRRSRRSLPSRHMPLRLLQP